MQTDWFDAAADLAHDMGAARLEIASCARTWSAAVCGDDGHVLLMAGGDPCRGHGATVEQACWELVQRVRPLTVREHAGI